MSRRERSKICIRNFKSFQQSQTISFHPSHSLIGIVGKNGVGKSCIVDAILFGCGGTKEMLHVPRLNQLITSSSSMENKCCRVRLVFVDETTKEEEEFERLFDMQSNASKFYHRNATTSKVWKNLTQKQYLHHLKSEVGLDITCFERFLVRQMNTISLAKSPPLQLLSFCEKLM